MKESGYIVVIQFTVESSLFIDYE